MRSHNRQRSGVSVGRRASAPPRRHTGRGIPKGGIEIRHLCGKCPGDREGVTGRPLRGRVRSNAWASEGGTGDRKRCARGDWVAPQRYGWSGRVIEHIYRCCFQRVWTVADLVWICGRGVSAQSRLRPTHVRKSETWRRPTRGCGVAADRSIPT